MMSFPISAEASEIDLSDPGRNIRCRLNVSGPGCTWWVS